MTENKGMLVADYYENMGYDIRDVISFCYTFRCNLQCAHCSYNCGPSRTEKMNTDDIKYILKEAAYSKIRLVELMGGEPFLDYAELSELVAYCSDIGLDVIVTTNGFWGKDYEIAVEKLKALSKKGLTSVLVSTDTFHQKFIPVIYALNIIRAARELKIEAYCNFCLSSDRKTDNILLNCLKKETDNIFTIDTVPSGRAFNSEKLSVKSTSDFQSCKSLVVNILPNADVFVCCGSSDINSDIIDTPLYMGNCLRENAKDVLRRKNMSCMEAFFDLDSPIWFKNFLKQESCREILRDKKYSHICELCKDMLNIEGISRKVMEYDPADKSERRGK